MIIRTEAEWIDILKVNLPVSLQSKTITLSSAAIKALNKYGPEAIRLEYKDGYTLDNVYLGVETELNFTIPTPIGAPSFEVDLTLGLGVNVNNRDGFYLEPDVEAEVSLGKVGVVYDAINKEFSAVINVVDLEINSGLPTDVNLKFKFAQNGDIVAIAKVGNSIVAAELTGTLRQDADGVYYLASYEETGTQSTVLRVVSGVFAAKRELNPDDVFLQLDQEYYTGIEFAGRFLNGNGIGLDGVQIAIAELHYANALTGTDPQTGTPRFTNLSISQDDFVLLVQANADLGSMSANDALIFATKQVIGDVNDNVFFNGLDDYITNKLSELGSGYTGNSLSPFPVVLSPDIDDFSLAYNNPLAKFANTIEDLTTDNGASVFNGGLDVEIFNSDSSSNFYKLDTATQLLNSTGLGINSILDIPGNESLSELYIPVQVGQDLFAYGENTAVHLGDGNLVVLETGQLIFDSSVDTITTAGINSIFDYDNNFFQGTSDTTYNNGGLDWQNGIALGGYNYTGYVDPTVLNVDGFFNTLPSGIVTDGFRPGAATLWDDSTLQFLLTGSIDDIFNGSQNFGGSEDYYYDTPLRIGGATFTGLLGGSPNWINIDPLVLDLDGDGVELVSFEDSQAIFDVDNDGYAERTGWVASDDAILVHDLNGDGVINDITETISEYYTAAAGAGTLYVDGLAALAILDSNSDGVFDALDNDYANLLVWQDADGDAITDAGELQGLAALGITSIDLTRTVVTREELSGNPVLSRSTMVINGLTQMVAAVDFTTNPIGYEWNDILEGVRIKTEDASAAGLVIGNALGATIDLNILNGDADPNNDVSAVIGNIGDDIIIGDAGENWLLGAAGSDTLIGGAGNDFLVIDADDDLQNIDAGSGFDIIQISGDRGIVLNLNDVNAEVALGGAGRDTIISGGTGNTFVQGGAGDDVLIGGSADDALSGDDGDDTIDGGYGDDVLRGHRGEDLLIGNEGEDFLDGGQDDDRLYGGAADDLLIGGSGNDELFGGSGYDVAEYSGTFDEYSVTALGANSFQVKDSVLGRDGTDILTDVEALNFRNLKEASLTLQSPIIANDIVLVSGAGSYTILASDILANDIDYQGETLSVTAVSNVVGGIAVLEASGDITFTPDVSYDGVMSFKYTVMDSAGNAGGLVFNPYNNATAEIKGTVFLAEADHPTDPLFYDQWYLNDINLLPVWEDYTGKGINVGIFEVQGIMDIAHPDLIGNLDQATLDSTEPVDWHATLVSGIVAASRNGAGSVGVAYDSKLTGYNEQYDGVALTLGDTNAQNYFKHDIVNNSWGWSTPFSDNFNDFPDSESSVFVYAADLGRDSLGTIIVFAAGNSRADGDSSNTNSWINNSYTITVGSVNKDADLASQELYQAPYSNSGANLLISAPGSYAVSTSSLVENANGSTFGNDYDSAQGTSFSAPIVSGVVALMLEANPNLGYRDVQEILAYSARIINDSGTTWQTNGATNWNGGGLHFSHDYGFGNVDALAAVRLAETWTKQQINENSYKSIAFNGNLSNATITDGGTITDSIVIPVPLPIEHVNLTLDFTHQQVGDLIVKLTSPDGTESIILDRLGKAPSNSADRGHGAEDIVFTFGSKAYLGELASGTWTLEVTDAVTGTIGTLRNWSLEFTGQDPTSFAGSEPPPNSLYIYTNEYSDQIDPSRQILQDSATSDVEDDTLNLAAISGDVNIDLTPGSISDLAGKSLTIAAGTTIERAFLGDGNDTLLGNDENNLLYGGRGDDIISGGLGNDWLLGKVGNDTLTGGAGADRFVLQKGDVGENLIQDFSSIEGDKIVIANYDTVTSITDLLLVEETGNTRITLPGGEEILLAGVIPSQLSSLDFIFDSDFLLYQLKLEEYIGTSGDDSNVYPGDTFKGYVMYGNGGNDSLFGSYGDDIIYGGAGNDTLVGASDASLTIGGADALYGEDGDDLLYGSGRSDILDGGAGNDVLYGGNGRDFIYLDGTYDQAYGEGGADTYIVQRLQTGSAGGDLIHDFDPLQERFDLRNFTELSSINDIVLTATQDTIGGSLVDVVLVQLTQGAVDQSITLKGFTDTSLFTSVNFIFSVDDIPDPVQDIYTIIEDTNLLFSTTGILANDTDVVDGTPTFTKIVTGPTSGILTDDSAGNYTYTPDANYFGSDSIIYEVIDSNGGTATSVISINITAVNDAPVVDSMPATLTVKTGLLMNYFPQFSDPDGDLITYSVVMQDGSSLPTWLTFDPATQRLSGTAPLLPEDVLLNLVASDGVNNTVHPMTLSVVTRAPVAADDSLIGSEDQDIAGNLLANNGNGLDSDPDGDVLSAQVETLISSQGGSVSILANGDFTYTPIADFNGLDSFSYTLLDDQGGLSKGSVTLTVNAVDDAPVLINNGSPVAEDGTVTLTTAMLNATDVDNTATELSFIINTLPTNGTLKLNGTAMTATNSFTLQDVIDGVVAFDPTADYNGTDGFNFTLSDGINSLSSDTFSITINPVNDAPIVANNGGVVNEDEVLTLTTAMLDATDVDNTDTELAFTVNTVPANGVLKLSGVAIVATNSFSLQDVANGAVTFAPAANYNGTDGFNFTLSDGTSTLTNDTFSVTVSPVSDAPVVSNNGGSLSEDGSLVLTTAMLNATDIDNTATDLIFTVDTLPANGVLKLSGLDFPAFARHFLASKNSLLQT